MANLLRHALNHTQQQKGIPRESEIHAIGIRRDLGRRARARAEKLAWPHLILDYERFYRDLAAGVGAKAPA